jgi:hypothetical protein
LTKRPRPPLPDADFPRKTGTGTPGGTTGGTIDAYLASLSPSERQAAEENFIQNLDAFSRDVSKERGWNSPIINVMWMVFMGGKVKHLKSFEEYV